MTDSFFQTTTDKTQSSESWN